MNSFVCLLIFFLQLLSDTISKPVNKLWGLGDDDCPRNWLRGTERKCYLFPWQRKIYMGRGEATKECAKHHPDGVPVEFTSLSEQSIVHKLLAARMEYEMPVRFWTGGMVDKSGEVQWKYLRNPRERMQFPDMKDMSVCVVIKLDSQGFRVLPAKSCATKASYFCQITLKGYEGSGHYNDIDDENDDDDDGEFALDAAETGSTPDYQNDAGKAEDGAENETNYPFYDAGSGQKYAKYYDDDDDDYAGNDDDNEEYYEEDDNCCEDMYLDEDNPWWEKK